MKHGSALALDDSPIHDEDRAIFTKISCSILLIEDNQSDVYLIKKMLQDVSRIPFEFTDVPRMLDAIKLLEEKTFDLILLDLQLLDVEGIASVTTLRALVPTVPIIVHSGANDPLIKEQSLMCGARHFLAKGCESPFAIKFMIEQIVNRSYI